MTVGGKMSEVGFVQTILFLREQKTFKLYIANAAIHFIGESLGLATVM